MRPEPRPSFDPDLVRDISEQVYKLRLEDPTGGGRGSVQRMIDNDKDSGDKLRNRAGSYDALTRAYLRVLGFSPANSPLSPLPQHETQE